MEQAENPQDMINKGVTGRDAVKVVVLKHASCCDEQVSSDVQTSLTRRTAEGMRGP